MTDAPVTDALRLDGVSRRFGALTALQTMSLTLPAGERHAILGANGAGKTTLFNLIAGDLRPSGGRIAMFGADVTRTPTGRRIRRGRRRTYQTSLGWGGLTGRQGLFLAARGIRGRRFAVFHSASTGFEMTEAKRLAARVGLDTRLDALAGELSHGEARQLELGMAMVGEPRLLLLDEPAAGLSVGERRNLLTLLRALPRAITLLLIEHDMDIALQAADRITVMHNGAHVVSGTPDDIAANQTVHDIYMGRHGR